MSAADVCSAGRCNGSGRIVTFPEPMAGGWGEWEACPCALQKAAVEPVPVVLCVDCREDPATTLTRCRDCDLGICGREGCPCGVPTKAVVDAAAASPVEGTFDVSAARAEALAALNSSEPDDVVGTVLARLLGEALTEIERLQSKAVPS